MVKDYYSERLERFGPTVEALGWGSRESQELRFQVLTELIPPDSTDSVLDFGCGFGDLYAYLRIHRPKAYYVGFDPHPEMQQIACSRYPEARFPYFLTPRAYVLASGVLNLDIAWRKTLKQIWSLAERGAAINFTSALTRKWNPEIYYRHPSEVLSFVPKLTRKFSLRHDYKENDFTLFLHR